MAYIQEKTKGKKIVSFKFKVYLGRDANGKQIFKCWTWYPSADLTPAKARKEADRVADRWEAEQRLAFSQQKVEEETAPPALGFSVSIAYQKEREKPYSSKFS